jgi:hypothetical protein
MIEPAPEVVAPRIVPAVMDGTRITSYERPAIIDHGDLRAVTAVAHPFFGTAGNDGHMSQDLSFSGAGAGGAAGGAAGGTYGSGSASSAGPAPGTSGSPGAGADHPGSAVAHAASGGTDAHGSAGAHAVHHAPAAHGSGTSHGTTHHAGHGTTHHAGHGTTHHAGHTAGGAGTAQSELGSHAASGGGSGAGHDAVEPSGQLPYTGFAAGAVAGLGATLLAAGSALRRAIRRPS